MKSIVILKNKELISNIILLLFGIILLFFPIESISIATKIIAGILIIAGLSNIIYFFIDKESKNKMDTIYFLLSLIAIGVGIYTFIRPTWLITTINIVVGLLLVITSLINLKYLLKYTTKNKLWWVFMIITCLILILCIIAIINPIKVASIITRLEGISLIFDAIMSLLIIKKYTKLLKESV